MEWYHYQTEHRLGYASRTQNRIWILQPSTCKRYYGEIRLVPLLKFDKLEDLNPKSGVGNKKRSRGSNENGQGQSPDAYCDQLHYAILYSNNNECKQLSLNSISCFIWYSLTDIII